MGNKDKQEEIIEQYDGYTCLKCGRYMHPVETHEIGYCVVCEPEKFDAEVEKMNKIIVKREDLTKFILSIIDKIYNYAEKDVKNIINVNWDTLKQQPATISSLCDEVLVANWFTKEHVEGFLDKKISEDEYLKILEHYNDHGIADDISEAMKEWLNENY